LIVEKPVNTEFTNKRVSIVIAALNPAELLSAQFRSFLNQKYKDIEIILNLDPRTNDNTLNIVADWKDRLDIKIIYNNSRLGEGRLEGAKAAEGKYLMHLDNDMTITEDLISECINLLNLGNDAININEEVIGAGFWTRCKWLEKRCYFGDWDFSSPRFFRKSTYFEVGGHNPLLSLSEDKDLDLRFKKNSKKITFSRNILFHNERTLSIYKTFKNKYFWSQTGFEYLAAQKVAAWKQVLFIFFRRAYLRNWKLFLTYPHLGFGMFMLKFAELLGVICGGIGTKLNIVRKREYKSYSSGSK